MYDLISRDTAGHRPVSYRSGPGDLRYINIIHLFSSAIKVFLGWMQDFVQFNR